MALFKISHLKQSTDSFQELVLGLICWREHLLSCRIPFLFLYTNAPASVTAQPSTKDYRALLTADYMPTLLCSLTLLGVWFCPLNQERSPYTYNPLHCRTACSRWNLQFFLGSIAFQLVSALYSSLLNSPVPQHQGANEKRKEKRKVSMCWLN